MKGRKVKKSVTIPPKSLPLTQEQLNGWYRAPSAWPAERDLNAFLRWFEWNLQFMVVDLANDPIEYEEIRSCADDRLEFRPANIWTLRGNGTRPLGALAVLCRDFFPVGPEIVAEA